MSKTVFIFVPSKPPSIEYYAGLVLNNETNPDLYVAADILGNGYFQCVSRCVLLDYLCKSVVTDSCE